MIYKIISNYIKEKKNLPKKKKKKKKKKFKKIKIKKLKKKYQKKKKKKKKKLSEQSRSLQSNEIVIIISQSLKLVWLQKVLARLEVLTTRG